MDGILYILNSLGLTIARMEQQLAELQNPAVGVTSKEGQADT